MQATGANPVESASIDELASHSSASAPSGRGQNTTEPMVGPTNNSTADGSGTNTVRLPKGYVEAKAARATAQAARGGNTPAVSGRTTTGAAPRGATTSSDSSKRPASVRFTLPPTRVQPTRTAKHKQGNAVLKLAVNSVGVEQGASDILTLLTKNSTTQRRVVHHVVCWLRIAGRAARADAVTHCLIAHVSSQAQVSANLSKVTQVLGCPNKCWGQPQHY